MVTSIGSATQAQAALAPVKKTQAEETAAAQATTAAAIQATDSDSAGSGSVETLSALSSATARVGDQLNAQADAARVDRARAEAPPAPPAGAPPPDGPPPAEGDAGTEAADAQAGAAPAGARPAGGGGCGASASSETESADYIAEADTNSDKKVSDQERAAYEKKLEQQAQDKSGAVQKAYGIGEDSEASVSATA